VALGPLPFGPGSGPLPAHALTSSHGTQDSKRAPRADRGSAE
jgi:hypothetical protein